jgi:hypothetical protein
MARILLTYLVPFLLPLVGYMAWIWYRTWYAEKHGGDAPKFEKGRWPLLLFLGAAFSLSILAFTAFTTGGDPDDVYVPAHMEDGKLVPGRMEKRPDVDQPQ